MLTSKKFWIPACVLILLGFLTWYWTTAHRIPDYARYIPGDVHGVLTINSKRIAADLLFGGNIKEDSTASLNKTISRWKKASERNGGIGISLSSDILAFGNLHPEHKKWYNGIILKLDDEAKLTRFITQELPCLMDTLHTHMTSLIENPGYKNLVIVNDESESPVCIGFNKEVLIILKAGFKVSDPAFFTREMKRLFNLPKDSSMIANENFRKSEKRAADLSLWYNLDNPMLQNILKSGKQNSSKNGALNVWVDFNKGSATLDIIHYPGNGKAALLSDNTGNSEFTNYIPKDKFLGMLFTHLDLDALLKNTKSEGKEGSIDHLFDRWGLTTSEVFDAFNGDINIALHGIVHFQEKYIAYEYDEDFNQIQTERFRDARMPGFTVSMGLKGFNAALKLLPKLLDGKHITANKTGNGFKLTADAPVYLTVIGKNLFLSSSPDTPPKLNDKALNLKEVTEMTARHHSGCFIDLSGIEKQYRKEYKDSLGTSKLDAVFTDISIVADPEKAGGVKTHIVAKCADPSANALVQLINFKGFADILNLDRKTN